MLQSILINFVMGVMGILLITLLDSKKYFFDTEKEWILTVFIADNIRIWILLVLIVLIISVIAGISPDSIALIEPYTGINLIANPAGFLTFGLMLKSVLKK